MKKLLLVLAVAVVAAPVASAGGWATVGLSSLPPTGLEAGQPWPVDVTVLQHGQTPLAAVIPVLRLRDESGKVVSTFKATPTAEPGVYQTVVRFPDSGTYTYEVYDNFEAYGGAKTHTFKPVTIAGPAGGSLPLLPLGIAAGLALALAAAAFLLVRRSGPAAEPATVTRLEEAA
ncbi:MAG: hypothetical protein H0V68_10055 [Actinobacteria bacterium]|nr:hypothetical protein [Actinomycetota bacterium]